MADGKHKGDPLYIRIKKAHVSSLNALKSVVFMAIKLELADKDEIKKHYQVINKDTWESKGVYFHSRLKTKGY